MAAFKAVLADEQILFTEGIKMILENMNNPKVEVIAAAGTGKDLLQKIETNSTDIILSEINFQDMDYEDLIKSIKIKNPSSKLFILSAYGDMKLVRSCFNLGVDGYLLKSNSMNDLELGLLEVLQGRIYLGKGLQLAPPSGKKTDDTKDEEVELNDRFLLKQKLTKREMEILKYIISGMNNRQISKVLFISDQTVGVHKKNIMKKLQVNSTPKLIEFVKQNKIV